MINLLDLFWILLICILVLFGLYFSYKLKFENFRFLNLILSLRKKYLTVFFVSIGTKIGVGSIIGTAISIYTGGAGSIFWIWVFALFTSSWIYVESLLGSKYKQKLNDYYVSGPNFYIKNGLNKKYLSIIFLVILTISYSFFFLMIQTNTLNAIININFNVNKIIVFIFAFIFLLLITFSSVKEIIKYINKVVPILCIFLTFISLYVIIINYSFIDDILTMIFNSALNFKSIITGLIPTILIAVKRNIFQNELLIGTTSISSAVSDDDADAHTIAKVQVLANLFISFIICSLVAFLILIFKLKTNISITNYNELISNVFTFHFSDLGCIILLILIILFSFTTIVSGFYFGLTNITFLTKNERIIKIFRLGVLIFTFSGFLIESTIIWWLIDFMMLILILINIYCIVKLRSEINYDRK